ncbi:MAG: hypothetical protein P8Y18_09695 [Candidatus Bathyarchaeota archaeon]
MSAIDLILVISVIFLLVLYLTKISDSFGEKKIVQAYLKQSDEHSRRVNAGTLNSDHDNFIECPRGYGSIKVLGTDSNISEKCLSCYMITKCYMKDIE